MALARQSDATLIKPLSGAVVRRRMCGGSVNAGDAVYLDSSGYVQQTAGTAVATNYCYGVTIQAGSLGDTVDVVVYGPCSFVTGATPGGIIYTSDTAGQPSATAGTKTTIIGVAESATVVFVRPAIVSLS